MPQGTGVFSTSESESDGLGDTLHAFTDIHEELEWYKTELRSLQAVLSCLRDLLLTDHVLTPRPLPMSAQHSRSDTVTW